MASAVKAKLIQIRVTPEQERQMKEAAAKQSMTVSEWIRTVMLLGEVAKANPGAFAAVSTDVFNKRPIKREVSTGRITGRAPRKRRTSP